MATQRTLSIIKPDAVAKNVIGKIYSRFESKGFEPEIIEKAIGNTIFSCNLNEKDSVAEQTNIYSEQIPVLYFNSNAEINSGFLTFYIF